MKTESLCYIAEMIITRKSVKLLKKIKLKELSYKRIRKSEEEEIWNKEQIGHSENKQKNFRFKLNHENTTLNVHGYSAIKK